MTAMECRECGSRSWLYDSERQTYQCIDCDWHLIAHANPDDESWPSPLRCLGVETDGRGRSAGRCKETTWGWDGLCQRHGASRSLGYLVKGGLEVAELGGLTAGERTYADAIRQAVSDAIYLKLEIGRAIFSPAKVRSLRRQAARIQHTTALSKPDELVYFCRREGIIKIGYSRDVPGRMKAIGRGGQMPPGMTVGPVELLATTPGGASFEYSLHDRFSASRIPKTEWFHPTPELLSLIDRYRRREEEQKSA